MSGTAETVVRPKQKESPERDRRMRHLLHHREGDIGVAFCGFRKPVGPLGPVGLSDCVVCNDLWLTKRWEWTP